VICQVAATSGNEEDMSVPLRENSFIRDVPSTTLTPHRPSHFHSRTQAGPDGSGPGVASIGNNGFGGIDNRFPRRGSANHAVRPLRGRANMGHQCGRTSLTCRGPRPVNPRSQAPSSGSTGHSKNDHAGTLVDQDPGMPLHLDAAVDTRYGFMRPCPLPLLRLNVRSPVMRAAAANRQVATHDQTRNSPP
jgi:hypothetical protein